MSLDMKQDIPLAAVAVDLAILTVREDSLMALAIRRGIPPFKGKWALPGGFVLPEVDLTAAAPPGCGWRQGRQRVTGHRRTPGHVWQHGRRPTGPGGQRRLPGVGAGPSPS